MSARASRDAAAASTQADPLRGFRDRFVIDDDLVYLDGNSLGALPRATVARLERVARQWGERGVRAWDEGWLDLPVEVGDRLGAAVLGAAPGQTAVGDSTTVCFYKLVARRARRAPRPPRDRHRPRELPHRPLRARGGGARSGAPTVAWLSGDPRAGPDPREVATLVDADTALVTFSHVSYRSAHIADMAAIDAVAHEAGALVLWDLSHSVGSVPLALDERRRRPRRRLHL